MVLISFLTAAVTYLETTQDSRPDGISPVDKDAFDKACGVGKLANLLITLLLTQFADTSFTSVLRHFLYSRIHRRLALLLPLEPLYRDRRREQSSDRLEQPETLQRRLDERITGSSVSSESPL